MTEDHYISSLFERKRVSPTKIVFVWVHGCLYYTNKHFLNLKNAISRNKSIPTNSEWCASQVNKVSTNYEFGEHIIYFVVFEVFEKVIIQRDKTENDWCSEFTNVFTTLCEIIFNIINQ